jgi:hypothetical protein
VGARAARTAQRLLAAIERCDAEIAALSRDASTGEVDRLTAQLGVLEPDETSGALVAPERRELRDLVARQLELVGRMRVRCELVSQRRARLLALMRGLWTQLSLLRNATAPDAGAAGPAISEHVRALCDEIEREVPGEAAVRAGDGQLVPAPQQPAAASTPAAARTPA